MLALLWNGFGCFDYLMTRMRNLDYFRSMAPDADPEAMLAWVDAFPIYAQFGWGLGVWMGLIGSVLLLMRHRWAVPALGLSFLGAVLGLGYQIFLAPPPPPPMNEGAMAIDAVGDHHRCRRALLLRACPAEEGRAAVGLNAWSSASSRALQPFA